MNVLGVHYGHNATVCLVSEGRIVFCQSEERLNRIKNSTGFPEKTLDYLYAHVCPPEEIDRAVLFSKSVYGYLYMKRHEFKAFQYGNYLEPNMLAKGLKQKLLETDSGWNLQQMRIRWNEQNPALLEEAHAYFSRELRLPSDRVRYCDHHTAHAYSTFPGIQDWDRALIFTLDGVGDSMCATVSLFEKGAFRPLSRIQHRNSLGYYYAATTALLGMRAGEHEFKVMGLAPYARPKYYQRILEDLRRLLWIDENGEWHSDPTPVRLYQALENIYRYQRFDNVAGAIQSLTEERIIEWVRFWTRRTGCNDIALAGGVFMNVKACQRLAELPDIGRLFVTPSAADESCAVGCAIFGTMEANPRVKIAPLRDLYLGMEFDEGTIVKALGEAHASDRYEITKPENINREVGLLLARQEIVARCSGRMEFGARALGNRSILANPSNFATIQIINRAIKSRDFWMPFTPSILEEEMPRYVANHDRVFAPYMCITFDSRIEARKDLIAAIHPQDFTVRPQCVRQGWNPAYHEIIRTFREETGIGGVLNTSFNLHGEPNVCSPQDAIRTVDNSGLKYLALGPYLLRKLTNQADDLLAFS